MKVLSKPTMSGLKNRVMDYGVGVGAGAAYSWLSGRIGSSFWGSALSAIGVGLVLPGERGQVVTEMLGFTAGIALGSGAGSNASSSSSQESVM